MTDHRRCDACSFFKVSGNSQSCGECRRNPPDFQDGCPRAKWPEVYANDFCGEFRSSKLAQQIIEADLSLAIQTRKVLAEQEKFVSKDSGWKEKNSQPPMPEEGLSERVLRSNPLLRSLMENSK